MKLFLVKGFSGKERLTKWSVLAKQHYRGAAVGKKIDLTDFGLDDTGFAGMIEKEDESQLAKWDYQTHSAWEWLAFITEELGELSKAVSEYRFREGHKQDIVAEAVQLATLAIKFAVMAKEDLS